VNNTFHSQNTTNVYVILNLEKPLRKPASQRL